ncbi:hypothetical protein ACJRO7_018962 [Eucalyptus globulus]|uniref:3'-5' exonuclease domain-containing protein n=1 Tax=Eucalyptus globulus TaxID=34317 RepID=A0ABD3KVM3_EUCGL
MHSLHKITSYGQQIYACITYDPSIVTRWINDVERAYLPWLNRLVVGLDIEWRPNLEPGVIHPVATLQLCVGHSRLIFQILHAEYIPGSLHAFLTNPNCTFVDFGIEDDATKLSDDYGLAVLRMVDLRMLAVGSGTQTSSLASSTLWLPCNCASATVASSFKSSTLSTFLGHSIHFSQIPTTHSSLDAFVTFKLGMALQASLVGRACVGGCVRPNCVMVPDPVGPILLRQFHS